MFLDKLHVSTFSDRFPTEDSKVESNDNPKISHRGETSDIPGLPSGMLRDKEVGYYPYCEKSATDAHLTLV